MVTVELATKVTVDDLLTAVAQLPTPELVSFVRKVLSLQSQRGVPLLAADEEQALLQVIQNKRLPLNAQQRLDALRTKSRTGPLSDAEQAELLTFVQMTEQQDLNRVQALVDLAKCRNTTLPNLLNELGLTPGHA